MKELIVLVIIELWSWSEAKAVKSWVKSERMTEIFIWLTVFVLVDVVFEFETAFA